MKNLPFKLKISLYYLSFIIILFSSMMYIIYVTSSNSSLNKSDDKLLDTINQSKEHITYKDGVFIFDEDLLEFDDVSIIIYDKYGNRMYGQAPRLFSTDTPFNSGLVK